MTVNELHQILALHRQWTSGKEGGRRANLAGADLVRVNLAGACLEGACLKCADFMGADFTGANLRRVNLEGANLTDANLTGAGLLGANLEGACFKGANLTGASFWGAALWHADLTGANLWRASFGGADLTRADLTGATLNWSSHDILAEILLRAAGMDLAKRQLAGLVLVSRDWCWRQFLALKHPLRKWAVTELARWVQPDDGAPEVIRERAEELHDRQ